MTESINCRSSSNIIYRIKNNTPIALCASAIVLIAAFLIYYNLNSDPTKLEISKFFKMEEVQMGIGFSNGAIFICLFVYGYFGKTMRIEDEKAISADEERQKAETKLKQEQDAASQRRSELLVDARQRTEVMEGLTSSLADRNTDSQSIQGMNSALRQQGLRDREEIRRQAETIRKLEAEKTDLQKRLTETEINMNRQLKNWDQERSALERAIASQNSHSSSSSSSSSRSGVSAQKRACT